eukprot:g3595.t1
MDEELQVIFDKARAGMDVLVAKLSFEEATVRLRNMELEASVHNFVLDNFSTLEFQFLAQLENSEKRAQQYKSILSESQRQLVNSKKTETSLKGALENCEGKLELLQSEVELAKRVHDEALQKANDPSSTAATKQLKRKEAELKKMQKQTEAEKKKLETKIRNVQDQVSELIQHVEFRVSFRSVSPDEKGSAERFDTEALRKSLHLSVTERTGLDEGILEIDNISQIDLTQEEEESEAIPESSKARGAARKNKSKAQTKNKSSKSGTRQVRKEPLITEIEPISSDIPSDLEAGDQEQDLLFADAGYSSSDKDDELFQTNTRTGLIVQEPVEKGIMTRARRRETLSKPPQQEQVSGPHEASRTVKKKKPPLPARLFENPMAVCNDKVKAACAENQNPDILIVNPFVIPVAAAGQRRVSGLGMKRKLGPRSIGGTGNSELNKNMQQIEDRPRKAQHNLANKKWRM